MFAAPIRHEIVIDRTPKRRRPDVDAVAMAIAGSVLLCWFVFAVIRTFYPEVIQ